MCMDVLPACMSENHMHTMPVGAKRASEPLRLESAVNSHVGSRTWTWVPQKNSQVLLPAVLPSLQLWDYFSVYFWEKHTLQLSSGKNHIVIPYLFGTVPRPELRDRCFLLCSVFIQMLSSQSENGNRSVGHSDSAIMAFGQRKADWPTAFPEKFNLNYYKWLKTGIIKQDLPRRWPIRNSAIMTIIFLSQALWFES